MKAVYVLIYILLSWTLVWCYNKINPVEDVSDQKVLKQILRTRNNVLVLFANANPATISVYKSFKDAALEVRGIGTLLQVDCSAQGMRLCRQQKAAPDPYVIHHYKDGKFHKVYDRKATFKSLVNFMQNPTGDTPWEEEPVGKNVVHIDSSKQLENLLKKHDNVMVMFYAPWCGFCKQMKPEYSAAAGVARTKGLGILAAVDVMRNENSAIRSKYNITAFPTVYLFRDGNFKAHFEGENKKKSLLEFLKDPEAVTPKIKEVPWSQEESDVLYLTSDTFDQTLKDHPSTLVMFYAPWCGHCKKLKPDWTIAASALKTQNIQGSLAAVDATMESDLVQRYKVTGYPTLKFFKNGEFAFDTPNLRDKQKIIEFMKDPQGPPPEPPPEPSWSEVPSEVLHLNKDNFASQLRSKRHVLVMFYAPWCGHCKSAKPEFEGAAEILKDQPRKFLAAVDCIENMELCNGQEVRGYPTFRYYKYLKESSKYNGGRQMGDFVKFFDNLEPVSSPTNTNTGVDAGAYPKGEKLKETVIHLTHDNYKDILSKSDNLFVLFYSRSCEGCDKLKQLFIESAASLETLAFCKAEDSPQVVNELKVKTFPTIKYFQYGRFVESFVGDNTATGLKSFLRKMKNTKIEL